MIIFKWVGMIVQSTLWRSKILTMITNLKMSLLLDIDYIFEWVKPVGKSENHFTFWVAPCTLIFKNVSELKSSIIQKEDRGDFNPVISDLYCKAPQADLSDYQHWIIETHDTGNIEFVSKGYTQVVRKLPLHTRAQRLTFEHREGFSFGLEPCKLFK